jgi:hypothetical protein
LKAREENDCRGLRRVRDFERRRAEHFDELLVDGLDDLLTWGEALGERLSTQAFAHRVKERAYDTQLNVGFEEGGTNVGEGLIEVGVGQAPA